MARSTEYPFFDAKSPTMALTVCQFECALRRLSSRNEAVSSVPSLLTGYTDTDTNGPLGEWLHLSVRVAGGAGEWASVIG